MDTKDLAQEKLIEDFWRGWFTDGPPRESVRKIRFFKSMPGEARCKVCFAPFDGFTAPIIKRILRVFPSRYNPSYCNVCDEFSQKYQGGAEVPVAMFFADIRGSTPLAEKIGARAYSKLINRFFVISSNILYEHGAMIEKLVGDEVVAVFSRGMSGEDYFGQAIKAGKELLRQTGHTDPDGPWVKVGIGIHSGETFVGSIGRPDGIIEVASLGDVPNTAARLTSLAGPGEILVSEETLLAAGQDPQSLEKRHLVLKGRVQEIDAYVIKI